MIIEESRFFVVEVCMWRRYDTHGLEHNSRCTRGTSYHHYQRHTAGKETA